MKHLACGVSSLILLFCAALTHAHKLSDSYLKIEAASGRNQIVGRWDIALRDLEHAIGVDNDGDGAITWGELHGREQDIARYAFAHLSIARVDAAALDSCPIEFERLQTDRHVDGAYAVLRFSASCAAPPERLAVRYSLLFDVDPNHRGLLDLRIGESAQAAVLSQSSPEFAASAAAPQPWTQMKRFVAEGVWHILHGYDHVLFLFTLLLPAVVVYRNGRWMPRASLRESVVDVVKVVTAFTLAHSLTLSLAALQLVSLPSRLVESAIAFTVILGALNNIFPVVTDRRWLVALAFGLIHGFGFASVLADLGLERANLAIALVGFNSGVELGQLAIVVVLAPLAYWVRHNVLYYRLVLPGASAAIVVVATYWFLARAVGSAS